MAIANIIGIWSSQGSQRCYTALTGLFVYKCVHGMRRAQVKQIRCHGNGGMCLKRVSDFNTCYNINVSCVVLIKVFY